MYTKENAIKLLQKHFNKTSAGYRILDSWDTKDGVYILIKEDLSRKEPYVLRVKNEMIYDVNNKSIIRQNKRKKLTSKEWNAISHLTHATHLDNVFDIYQKRNGEDGFKDYETGRITSISAGLKWLYEGLAYPFSHEGLNREESLSIYKLFQEFKTTKEDISWLLA